MIIQINHYFSDRSIYIIMDHCYNKNPTSLQVVKNEIKFVLIWISETFKHDTNKNTSSKEI